jgi:hypothetical protein
MKAILCQSDGVPLGKKYVGKENTIAVIPAPKRMPIKRKLNQNPANMGGGTKTPNRQHKRYNGGALS